MSKLEITQIYLQLKREINQMCKQVDSTTKELLKNDAKEAITIFKPEIDSWVSQLAERKIACYELEGLIKLKISQVKLTVLENTYTNEDEYENFKSLLLCLIARTISNSYLENLYKAKICSSTRYQSDYKW